MPSIRRDLGLQLLAMYLMFIGPVILAAWVFDRLIAQRLEADVKAADLEQHSVIVRGKSIELTSTEFNLLVYLMENAGKVLPHQTLLKHVWGPEYGPESEYLRVYIGRLRQKVEVDRANPRHLLTERGLGYSFQA